MADSQMWRDLTSELTEWYIDGDDYDGQHLTYQTLYREAFRKNLITVLTYTDAEDHYRELGIWKEEVGNL